MKKQTPKSSTSSSKKSSRGSSSSSDRVISKVKSSTQAGVVHTQKMYKGKKVCSCQGFKFQGKCKHLPGVVNPTPVIQRVPTTVKGKTTRATMLNLLLKAKAKLVGMKAIFQAVQKVTGYSDAKVEKRIKVKTGEVNAWAKKHGMKLTTNTQGMRLAVA